MLLYIATLPLVLGIGLRIPRALDWCSYWSSLGIEKEECSFLRRDGTTATTTTDAPIIIASPVCLKKFFTITCRTDYSCSSGLMCTDTLNNNCCHPPKDMCPTFEQVGFECKVKNPVNWCLNDSDCGSRGKCCPTGCEYNICA